MRRVGISDSVSWWLIALGLLTFTACDRRSPMSENLALSQSGVSLELASDRRSRISDLRYQIELEIPSSRTEPIRGELVARFNLESVDGPLLLDFAQPSDRLLAVGVGGEPVAARVVNEHVVIPASALAAGPTDVRVEFLAGESSLNRHDDYLYTLFVPDRARFALPLFDQPDLKSRVSLALEIPADWLAVANGPELERRSVGDRVRIEFAETRPLSTYLLAFAAGRFEVEQAEHQGRTLRLFHRETDRTSVRRNATTLFDLHTSALAWLEDYTGIAYPFQKLDFVALPAFQYGGMEHPGAIFYRDRSLFLEESATQNQILGRASLIAHETAHMWFGNLVTMEWFSDVWMKEVFANFMAAKVVHPTFPEVDHELRFLLSHYSSAYGVDRTPGANPVRQRLENLNNAGSLYGAIIYQKAPILMKHLELLMGEEPFRDGLRSYLEAHRYGNASWPDLIEVLDSLTSEDLEAWSAVWVEQPGRPEVSVAVEGTAGPSGETVSSLVLRQRDPWGRGRLWNQRLELLMGGSQGDSVALPVKLEQAEERVARAIGRAMPDFVLANGAGVGYGRFVLGERDRAFLVEHLPELEGAKLRVTVWLSLVEEMLERRLLPLELMELGLRMLEADLDELEVQRVLATLSSTFWRHLSTSERNELVPRVEEVLWQSLLSAPRSTLKASFFGTYRSVASTAAGLDRLRALWNGALEIEGLRLAENDLTDLALALAVREVEGWEQILETQARRLENPDRRERFTFLRPAVSADASERDHLFESLLEPENRSHEPWVLTALRLLHHPLRATSSERYLRPALDELEEIQKTGDIFFPLGWLEANLGGHSSSSAADVVREFLEQNSELEPRLRGKLLQAADSLFRAAAIADGDRGPIPQPL